MEYSLWNLPPGLWQANQGTIPLDSVPRPYYASATLPILPPAIDVSDGDLNHYGVTNTTGFRPPDFLPTKNIFPGRPPMAHSGDDKTQLEGMLQIGELMESASNDSAQLSLSSPPLMSDQRRLKRRGSDSYDLQSDEASQHLEDYARQQSFQHPMYGMLLSQMAACKQEEAIPSDDDEGSTTPTVEPPSILPSTSDFIENESVTDRSAGSSRAGYECGDCGLVADTEVALKRHMLQAHSQQDTSPEPKPSAVCPIESCRFRTADTVLMEVHVARHVADGATNKKAKNCPVGLQRVRYEREEYRCQLCSYSCTIEKAYQKHLKIHSMGVPAPIKISCVICGKDRQSEVDMNKHMKKHRDDRYFCCDICIFRTVQLKKLVQHRRMHTGEKPHLCPHCSYRSARRDNLRSHVRRVHKKENLYCDTFSPRSVLMSARPSALTQDGLPPKNSPPPSN